MSQGRGVRISDEVIEGHRTFAIRAKTTNFSGQSEKHSRPITARISLGKRAANRAAIAHLNIGNARGAVVENRDFPSHGRCLDLCMPGQRAEANRAVVFLYIRSSRNEVQINEMGRVRVTKLH